VIARRFVRGFVESPDQLFKDVSHLDVEQRHLRNAALAR
jgi:hypothetical protein